MFNYTVSVCHHHCHLSVLHRFHHREVILINIKSMRVVTSAVTAALHCHTQIPLCKVNAVIVLHCVSKKK